MTHERLEVGAGFRGTIDEPLEGTPHVIRRAQVDGYPSCSERRGGGEAGTYPRGKAQRARRQQPGPALSSILPMVASPRPVGRRQ